MSSSGTPQNQRYPARQLSCPKRYTVTVSVRWSHDIPWLVTWHTMTGHDIPWWSHDWSQDIPWWSHDSLWLVTWHPMTGHMTWHNGHMTGHMTWHMTSHGGRMTGHMTWHMTSHGGHMTLLAFLTLCVPFAPLYARESFTWEWRQQG